MLILQPRAWLVPPRCGQCCSTGSQAVVTRAGACLQLSQLRPKLGLSQPGLRQVPGVVTKAGEDLHKQGGVAELGLQHIR